MNTFTPSSFPSFAALRHDGHLHARRSCATMKTFSLPYFAALNTFTPSSFPSFAALLRHPRAPAHFQILQVEKL
jgi:hypothetical protein